MDHVQGKPLLTIITPVFNGQRFLRSCLDSVIKQRSPHIEHLIIDGGSTDGLVPLLQTYAQQYDHIHFISEKDSGQSSAMNKGIRLARGRFIGFLNADDFYEPGTLNDVCAILPTLTKPCFLVGNCNVWDNEMALKHVNKPRHLDLISIISTWNFPTNPSAYFYDRMLHDMVGYYDEHDHYSMDLGFLLRALPLAQATYVNQTWGNYRQIDGTKTAHSMQEGKIHGIIKKHMDFHYHRLPFLQKLLIRYQQKFK